MDTAVMNALCPRCGYDKRGVIATWRELCPLSATCTECGFEYSCAEMLRPEKFEPRWCVEYCDGEVRTFVRSCGRTFVRSLLPWRFWSRLQMAHRIRPKRIALYVAAMVLPIVLVYVLVQTSAALYARSITQSNFDLLTSQAQLYASQPDILTDEEVEERLIRIYGKEWVERFKQTRGAHWENFVIQYREFHIRQLKWSRAVLENPPRVASSALVSIVEAVLQPLAGTSRTAITASEQFNQTYPAPREIWGVLLESITGPAGFGWINIDPWVRMVKAALALLGCGLLLTMLFPLSIALLPISLRRAKVRWAHIARIAAYGAVIPYVSILLVAVIIAVDGVRLWQTGATTDFQWVLMILAIGFVPLGTTLWWLFALNRHLKLPHALAVTAILMVMCLLAVLAAVYHYAPHWLGLDM